MSNHNGVPDRDLAHILTPPPKRTLAHEVLDRLRNAILRGQLPPGQQLREQSLAESLGVSRGPIREALSQLEREGLVIRERNRTATVAGLSRKDLDEIHSLRISLESLAIVYVCRNIIPADLDAMQSVVNTMATCRERGATEQEAAELDLHFHDILYQASRHERLIAIWSNLRHQFYLILLNRNVANPDFAELMAGGHQEILDAIRDRDMERAKATVEHHLRFAYETVLASQQLRSVTS